MNPKPIEKSSKLKVAEAIQDDVGKGIVRIDTGVMKELGIAPGDVVEIIGEKTTVGIVDRAYPADLGLSIIRMDGLSRWNAKSGIGELVIIKKATISKAAKVSIAPAQKGMMIQIAPEMVGQALLGRAVVKGDIITLGGTRRRRKTFSGSPFEDIFRMIEEDLHVGFGLGDIKFVVTSTTPKGAVLVTSETDINVSAEAVEFEEKKVPEVSYEDLGGVREELNKVRELVEIPLKHPEIFERLGVEPPKGVLLYGPPGTGKTLMAKAVANEADAYFVSIAGPEIMSKWVGEAEKKLRQLFEDAEKNAPAIIFIDEIDAIATKREEAVGEVERRVVAQLLAIMDGMKSRGKVVVIAATNRPNDIDPALRRPGRFDREIEIGVPDRAGRLDILKIHTRNMPLAKDVEIEKLADVTHGFVGADLAALAKEAAMSVIRRLVPDLKWKEGEPLPKELLEKLIVTMKDFKNALNLVRPSLLREVLIETPRVSWDDVGGLEDVKQKLKEAVEWPIKNPKAFVRMGIKPPKGILLMGPPGTGKTLLAKAVAKESEANFISVKGPEIMSKWVGESEKAIREIFRRARQSSPCIIFFDEIDSIAPRRSSDTGARVTEQVIAQMLTEMDGLEDLSDVVIIGATNRPDIVDPGLLRPRFDRIILVPPPDMEAREQILKVHTKGMPLAKNVSISKLAEETEGYSGADLEAVAREAGTIALRENINATEVTMKHVKEALEAVRASVTKADTDAYQRFLDKFNTRKAEMVKEIPYMG